LPLLFEPILLCAAVYEGVLLCKTCVIQPLAICAYIRI